MTSDKVLYQSAEADRWFEKYLRAAKEIDRLTAENEKLWAVAKLGPDLDICHYEWCDAVRFRKREIPPPECDCGVRAFKQALNAFADAVLGTADSGDTDG